MVNWINLPFVRKRSGQKVSCHGGEVFFKGHLRLDEAFGRHEQVVHKLGAKR